MPKKIDPAVKERALRSLREHRGQYPSLTAACAAVARQERVGAETVRRWVVEAIEQIAYARGRRRLTPEGLYGRRKMLACLRRRGVAATPGAVDRGMPRLGLSGVLRT